ncbi:protein of unknown function [Burkholderia multivorans]
MLRHLFLRAKCSHAAEVVRTILEPLEALYPDEAFGGD